LQAKKSFYCSLPAKTNIILRQSQYSGSRFVSVLLYVAFFAVGLGPGVRVYMAEIFLTNLRGRAMSVASSALWASCLAVTLTLVSIMHAAGVSGVFSLYAILSLMAFLFVWKWLPETPRSFTRGDPT
jgi:sugar transport protein